MIIEKIAIDQYFDKKSIFFKLWNRYEKKTNLPNYLKKINIYNYEDFKEKIFSNSNKFAEEIVLSLLSGNAIILKNAFEKSFLSHLKNELSKIFLNSKSEFHKIVEHCPNFYRNITADLSKKYAFKQIKHTHYFFPWNEDFNKLYFETFKKWQVIKYLSGYKKNAFEKNTPKNGIVDRIQIVKYPFNIGNQVLHQDPYLYQKFFISVYMSKKGKDYIDGGMYFVDQSGNKIDLEELIDIGDLAFGFATLHHGVDITKILENQKEDSSSGRWFMGLYSTVSDYVKNRHTGNPVKKNQFIYN